MSTLQEIIQSTRISTQGRGESLKLEAISIGLNMYGHLVIQDRDEKGNHRGIPIPDDEIGDVIRFLSEQFPNPREL